jgi:putative salt-induced outer membrane protein YdiY
LKRVSIWVALFLMGCCSSVFADQVVLKNGDRLTGTIVKSDGKDLVIKSALAGEVTVPMASVQEIVSTAPLHVSLKTGGTVVGPVTTSNGMLEVATRTTGTIETPKEGVLLIRSEGEQAAYEKSLHPGFKEGWTGGVNLGFALTRGNSATKNLNIAFGAARKGFHDKLSLYSNSIYATNDLPAATPHTTANSIGGGARYDRDLTPRVFGFMNGDFYHDSLQSLDLRSLFGGGLGLHAIKNDATTLDLLAGANYTHESYSVAINPPNPAKTRNQAGLTFGDDFMHKLGKSAVFTQNWYFYPNLSQTGQYRTTFNLGFITKLNKWLGWQNSFGDIYVSNPPLGKKKNDLLISTGLNFSFTH